MAQGFQEEQSWSGLGVGTDRESFLEHVRERLPDNLDPIEAAEAVFCALSQRISGGTATKLFEEMPADVRDIFRHCERHSHAPAPAGGRDDFYLGIAEHLLIEPEMVRLVLHAVFGAIHSQITEAQSERIAAELPATIESTWVSSRHNVPAPH